MATERRIAIDVTAATECRGVRVRVSWDQFTKVVIEGSPEVVCAALVELMQSPEVHRILTECALENVREGGHY